MHGDVDDLAGALDAQLAGGVAADLNHPEVDLGGEAAVELDLEGAEVAAALEGGVVEELEAARFLELEDLVADQEHHRDVGLHDLDGGARWVAERLGSRQLGDQLGQRHRPETPTLWRGAASEAPDS